jgi:hypothetical protein
MDPYLESIVAADEEARARVESARVAANARIGDAERVRDRRREERALSQAADDEEREINAAVESVVADRQSARRRYLETSRQAAAEALPRAADLFAQIISHLPPPVHAQGRSNRAAASSGGASRAVPPSVRGSIGSGRSGARRSSAAFATATVLQRHYGWRLGLPVFAAASYTAASRLTVNKHWASDVTFGAVVGIVSGRTVTVRLRGTRLAVVPRAVPGGGAVVLIAGRS